MTEIQNSKQVEPRERKHLARMFWSLEFGILKLFGISVLGFGI
jgi:hypothetical protein